MSFFYLQDEIFEIFFNLGKIVKGQRIIMPSFEEELKRFEPIIRRLCNFALLGKKIEVKGRENFMKEGPAIIVGNHIGSFKDVATLLKIVPRPIFFTANKMIFNKDEFSFLIRKHLQRHLKNFGLYLNLMLNPFKSLFVHYISLNLAKVGTIPVDLYRRKNEAIEQCQEYLRKGRAIITLQGRGRVFDKDPHPYVKSFKRGTSIIAYNLYKKDGINLPVTPLAIFGTQFPFLVPVKIKVSVGSPMYITDYLVDEVSETIEKFRNALEARVKSLFLESLKA
jgi:1-acyl-sn-glycerol-3-phosphate acyltransferase